MAIYKSDIVDIELNSGSIHRSFMNHSIGAGDAKANRFGVRLFRNGEPVSAESAAVTGLFMAPDGTRYVISETSWPGSTGKQGNTAYVQLPGICYAVMGQFTLAIKLTGSGVEGTMRIVDGTVDETGEDGAVVPTSTIPATAEIIAAYEEAVEVIGSSVRFDVAQTLEDSEKETARENIGAAGADDLAESVSVFAYYNSNLYESYHEDDFLTTGTYLNNEKVFEGISFKKGTTYIFTVRDNYKGQNRGYIYLKNGDETQNSFILDESTNVHFVEWTPAANYTNDIFVGWDTAGVSGTLVFFVKPYFNDVLIEENESWGE